MSDAIAWRDDYNIGIEIVDKAHQQLFTVAKRLLALTSDGKKGEFAYAEGIKYLKAYTTRHFAEEEACMRELNFSYYEVHKRIHDRLRDETIPAMERSVEESGYAPAAIEEFLGMYIGWLMFHIMMTDQMITGKIPVKSLVGGTTLQEQMEQVLTIVSEEAFHAKTEVVRDRTVSNSFPDELSSYYQVTYESPNCAVLRFCFVIEDRMVQRVLQNILDMEEFVSRRTSKAVTWMLAQAIVRRLCIYVDIDDAEYEQHTKCIAIQRAEAVAIYHDTVKRMEDGGDGCSVMLSADLGNFAVMLSVREGACGAAGSGADDCGAVVLQPPA